jgi:hypothetical protein
MAFTIVALAVGLATAIAAGGRPSNATLRPLRAVGVLAAAVLLQVVPAVFDLEGGPGLACVLGSYALLVAFALVNVRLVGMPVVLVGLLCNVVVIGANAGMPVRTEALRQVDPGLTAAELADLDSDLGAKRHIETGDDVLTFLGDVVPVRPLGQVLSFGDLILAVGLADVTFRLLKPAAAIRRRRRPTVAEVIAMLPAPAVTELRRSA